MANLMTSMGFPCTHEAVFTPKGLSYAREVLEGSRPAENSVISEGKRCIPEEGAEFVAESSYMSAPFLADFNCKVIHVVRNPFSVVASLIGDGFRQFTRNEPTYLDDDPRHLEYEQFIYDHLPSMRKESTQLDRACLFYVSWNRMIEESGRVSLFHRIEDDVEKVKEFLGFKGEYHYDNRKCNSVKERREWKVSEISNPKVRDSLLEMASRYGYNMKKIF